MGGQVISVELATALKQAGLVWHPASGDRFTLTTGAFDDEVFTLSDMVVEAQQSRTGTVLGFNGTTEWALDSIEQQEAVWLPREDQLRTMLGDSFIALQTTPGGFVVTVVHEDREERHIDIDAECAYARAVLSVHSV